MPDVTPALIISSFIAGILMFLAPCTLPLIPGYIAFISGVSEAEIRTATSAMSRMRVVRNAAAFSLGFSIVFIFFGIVAGLFGAYIGTLRVLFTELAGIVVIVFGLSMLNVLRLPFLNAFRSIKLPSALIPGRPQSAFLIGGAFALGWTPCIGPVFATVLLFASTSTTVLQGAFLLAVFSCGLSIPFMLTAVAFGSASALIARHMWITKAFSIVGGSFLIVVGILLLTQHFALTLELQIPWFNLLQNFY